MSKKTLILLGLAALLLVGGGGAALMVLNVFGDGSQTSKEVAASDEVAAQDRQDPPSEQKAEEEPQPPPHGGPHEEVTVNLNPFVVNLGADGTTHYLRTVLGLSLREEADKEILEKASARVRDAVVLLLSGRSAEELLTTEGKIQLRLALASQINDAIGEEAVRAVYFVDFVIQ